MYKVDLNSLVVMLHKTKGKFSTLRWWLH